MRVLPISPACWAREEREGQNRQKSVRDEERERPDRKERETKGERRERKRTEISER